MSQAIAGSLSVSGSTTLNGVTASSAAAASATVGDLVVTSSLSAPSLSTLAATTLTAGTVSATGSVTAPSMTATTLSAGTVTCTDAVVGGLSLAQQLPLKVNASNGSHTGTTSMQTLALGTGLAVNGTTVTPAELALLQGATGQPLQQQLNSRMVAFQPLVDEGRLSNTLGLQLSGSQAGLSRADTSIARVEQASAQGGEVVAATVSCAGLRNERIDLTVQLAHRLQFVGATAGSAYSYQVTVGTPTCRVYRNGVLFATPTVQLSTNRTFPLTISSSGSIGATSPMVLDQAIASASLSFTPSGDALYETSSYEVRFQYGSWSRVTNVAASKVSDGLLVNSATLGTGASWYQATAMSRTYTPTLPAGTSTLHVARGSVTELTAGAVTVNSLTATGTITGALGSMTCLDLTSAGPVRVNSGAFVASPWQAGVLCFDGSLTEPLNESTRVFWCSMKQCAARDDLWVCMPGWSASLYADVSYQTLLVDIGARWALSPQVTASTWGNNRVKSVKVFFNGVEQTLPTLS